MSIGGVHVHILRASATGCAHLCISMFFNITSKPVHLHTPALSFKYNNTSPRVHLDTRALAVCMHIFCASATGRARLRMFIAGQICKNTSYPPSSAFKALGSALKVLLITQTSGKGLLDANNGNECSFCVFSHGAHSPSWFD